VLSLWVENTYHVQETFKLTWSGPVLGPVAPRPLHVGHGAIRFPLLVIVFGGAGSV
jgi:hypothetical protein